MGLWLYTPMVGAFLGIQYRYWAIIVVVVIVILALGYFARSRST